MKKGSLIRIRESITTPGGWVGRLAVVVEQLKEPKHEARTKPFYVYVRFLDTGQEAAMYKEEVEEQADESQ